MTDRLSSSPWRIQIPFHPWIYFGIFLTANTLLSYFPLSVKLWVGIFGLALPILLVVETLWNNRDQEKPLQSPPLDSLPVPLWAWILFFILLVLTRFYRLTTLPFWPLSDEGTEASLGIGLSQHWSWNLLWTQTRVEPLMYWLLGVYFKLVTPSLFSIRLFPTIVSLLTVFAAYRAARRFFSKFHSFLTIWIFAFSFWEFTLTRLCSLVILIPLFECWCFERLGRFLAARNTYAQWGNLFILALVAGVGFYSWTNWAGIWLVLLTILIIYSFNRKPARPVFIVAFGILSLVPALPLVLARLAPGELNHIQSLGGWEIWKTLPLYLEGLYWNGSYSFPFGSNWGGFLNPILGSLVLIGLLDQARVKSPLFTGTMMTCLFFSGLPGFISNGMGLYRVLPLLPLLMVLAASGIESLVHSCRKPLVWVEVFILILGSFFLDIFNYQDHYAKIEKAPPGRQWRNTQYYEAYEILEKLSRESGPLYVFSEFNTDYDNKTLNIACYPFDPLQNSNLSPHRPQWTALIINLQYSQYFIRNFRGLQLKILNMNGTEPQDTNLFALFLIPVSQMAPSMLNDWIRADHIYREVNLQTKGKNPTQSWDTFAESLSPLKDKFSSDRFLTAVYWEKIGFFKFLAAHFFEATRAYQNAVNRGIPSAHLFYDLGVCSKIISHEEESKKYFEKARSFSLRIH